MHQHTPPVRVPHCHAWMRRTRREGGTAEFLSRRQHRARECKVPNERFRREERTSAKEGFPDQQYLPLDEMSRETAKADTLQQEKAHIRKMCNAVYVYLLKDSFGVVSQQWLSNYLPSTSITAKKR